MKNEYQQYQTGKNICKNKNNERAQEVQITTETAGWQDNEGKRDTPVTRAPAALESYKSYKLMSLDLILETIWNHRKSHILGEIEVQI